MKKSLAWIQSAFSCFFLIFLKTVSDIPSVEIQQESVESFIADEPIDIVEDFVAEVPLIETAILKNNESDVLTEERDVCETASINPVSETENNEVLSFSNEIIQIPVKIDAVENEAVKENVEINENNKDSVEMQIEVSSIESTDLPSKENDVEPSSVEDPEQNVTESEGDISENIVESASKCVDSAEIVEKAECEESVTIVEIADCEESTTVLKEIEIVHVENDVNISEVEEIAGVQSLDSELKLNKIFKCCQ